MMWSKIKKFKHFSGILFVLQQSVKRILFLLILLPQVLFADLKTAKKEYAKQNYKQALSLFSQYSSNYPSSGESYLYQGYIYEQLKNYPKSIEMFKRVLEAKSEKKDKITASIKIVVYYQYYKDWKNTVYYSKKLLELSPGNSIGTKAQESARENGFDAEAQNVTIPTRDDPESLIQYYESLLVKYPDNEKILWELSLLYYEQKKYTSADSKLNTLISQKPENKNYLYKAGMVKIKIKDYATGIKLLDRVIKETAESETKLKYYSLYNRGYAHYKTENYENAISDYKSSYTLQKGISPLIGLARIYYSQDDCNKLSPVVKNIQELKKDHLESDLYQLYCLLNSGDNKAYSLMPAVLNRLQADFPEKTPKRYHKILYQAGIYYANTEDYPKSLFYLKDVEPSYRDSVEYLFLRGKTHYNAGQYSDAIAYLKRITNSSNSNYLIAKSYAKLNHPEKAKEYLLLSANSNSGIWEKAEMEEAFENLRKSSSEFNSFILNRGKKTEEIPEQESNGAE